MTVRRWRWNYL